MVLLTNGSEKNTRHLVRSSNLEDYVNQVYSIEQVHLWKPRKEVYLHAAEHLGISPNKIMLVAAHSWDTHGAKSAGLMAAWLPRSEKQFPDTFIAPDIIGDSIADVTEILVSTRAANRSR